MMTIDDLREILALVREHEITEFELEQEGVRLRLRKQVDAVTPPVPVAPAAMPATAGAGDMAATAAPVPLALATSGPAPTEDVVYVTAPLVGTFYRAPSPEAPPFVERGVRVKKGQVLCIIEAMKLMNEIESEYEGEIVDICVENGQPVQYGERLFAIARR